MNKNAPILEFDDDRAAILMPDPYRFAKAGPIPARGVLCFFQDVLDDLKRSNRLTLIGCLRSEIGENPVYSYEIDGKKITVAHPGVGAPLSAGFLEELIAVGVTKFIACGGAGALDPDLIAGHPVILTSAVRDEGTSFHYLPPGREVKPHPRALQTLIDTLNESGLEYLLGKSWTTDAIYRETKGKRKQRLEEGCSVVEMEAAAFFAVAQFREIPFAQLVYAGDLVIPDGWDGRDWNDRSDDRRLIFDLAARAAAKM